jgi:hypothetical protein
MQFTIRALAPVAEFLADQMVNYAFMICGGGVEQWPDAAAAQQRADYLKAVLSAAQMLGTEYAIVRGNLLLRVQRAS